MKHHSFKYTILSLLCLPLLIASCSDWDTHTAITDPNLGKSALEVIQGDAELSIFYDMVVKTGYDTILTEYPACTVFAPVNSAWSSVDTDSLDVVKGIVGSMITSRKFRAGDATFTGKMLTVNGKSMKFDATAKTFENASILIPDLVSSNAYIHKVDQVVRRKDNVWEYLQKHTEFKQVSELMRMNTQVMDPDKSLQIGIDDDGRIVYDTVWMETNALLQQFPMNHEDSTFTYVIVKDQAYDNMVSKYLPYFKTASTSTTDSLVRYNVCADYLFRGAISPTDQLNVNGVLVPLSSAIQQQTPVECSNGRIYVIDAASISMSKKIQPVRIEGEDYTRCMNEIYLYKRYKRWASGRYDVMLNGSTSYESMTYSTSSGNMFNGINYWIEFKAPVYNVKYKIRYVSYDDMGDSFEAFLLSQKLFVSLPGKPVLAKKTGSNINGIGNNFKADTCFVGQSYCGSDLPSVTYLSLWTLTDLDNQYIGTKLTAPGSDILDVTKGGMYGTLTMWLCNTTAKNYALAGPLFLDYIELVPQVAE
jgi:uncharacterized surface protein with fasciclin (FAS1) repeats